MATYYLTTPIYYPNAKPHIGTAFCTIGCDVQARYRRLKGYDTFFLTGLDENSLNVERQARSQGRDPQDYCDEMAEYFRDLWERLNISYDGFIRTTEEQHKHAARLLLQKCFDAGDIYKGTYAGWYCLPCEAFYADDDLVEGKCPVHDAVPEWTEEDNYFFALSKYQDRLLALYEEHPEFVLPDFRRNEVVNMVRGELRDFSISRANKTWGIPVPFDEEQVIYVWFDALTNYITGVGFGHDDDMFARYWPSDVHVVGKDIIRFHCVYWPAMLMSAGVALPKTVWAHGWIMFRGEKMSKSRGVGVDPFEMVDEFGADAVRFYLMREIPFDQDGVFSWESFYNRYNADLANDLGNLVHRTTSMISRYFDGVLPSPGAESALDASLREIAESAIEGAERGLEAWDLDAALDSIWTLVTRANQYIEENAPWALAKDANQRERLGTVLYNVTEAVRILAVLLGPYIPATADTVLQRVGEPALADGAWERGLTWGTLTPERTIASGKPLFPRLEVAELTEST